MGNTWEVKVWAPQWKDGEYYWSEFWRGESFILAVWHLFRAKRQGYGCVAMYWR